MVKCKKVVVNISNLLILAQQKCHRPDCSEMITSCTHLYVWITCIIIDIKNVCRHTGALESLHSLMLLYCPKRVQFR